MDESKIPLGDAVVGMNSEIRGLYERYETAAPVMISGGVFTRPQSFAQWLVGQLGEHIAREAELQAEIERLMSLDGERCKSHNFYLILSSRLEDEVARKQLDCDALTARVKTLEDALTWYASPIDLRKFAICEYEDRSFISDMAHWGDRARRALAAKEPK